MGFFDLFRRPGAARDAVAIEIDLAERVVGGVRRGAVVVDRRGAAVVGGADAGDRQRVAVGVTVDAGAGVVGDHVSVEGAALADRVTVAGCQGRLVKHVFGNKRVITSIGNFVISSAGCRIVGRSGIARNVKVANAIDNDVTAILDITATQKRRKCQVRGARGNGIQLGNEGIVGSTTEAALRGIDQ